MQNSRTICVTAQKLGIPKSTVSFLFQMALSHGEAKVAESIQLPDTQLLETFYTPTTKGYQEPDWVEVHKKLARRNVTLKLLYDAYKSQVIRRAYTYTSFCRRYSEWRQANGLGVPNGNVQVIPGERMEINFAGDNLKWIDPNCDVQGARLFIWDEGTKNGPDRSALLGHNFVYQKTKPHGFYSSYFHQRISS